MTADLPNVVDLADSVLPLDGPYPPDNITAAARLLAALVRRLNHATAADRFDYPSQIDAIVSGLAAAVSGLPQLFRQLATALPAVVDQPGVYADQLARGATPTELAERTYHHLHVAGSAAVTAANCLSMACENTARLGIREQGAGDA